MLPKIKKGQCRFCLEDDFITSLIAPCVCKGSFKYVHNECLIGWYKRQPEKGLICAVCKQQLTRTYSQELEYYPDQREINLLCIEKPFWSIGMNHTLFFTIMNVFLTTLSSQYHLHAYHLFQILFHLFYLCQLHSLVKKVKNMDLYMFYWRQAPRFILPFFHFSLCVLIYKTYWLGGAAADMCLFMYIYEHLEVIQLMNQNRGFMFASLKSQKRLLLSSS